MKKPPSQPTAPSKEKEDGFKLSLGEGALEAGLTAAFTAAENAVAKHLTHSEMPPSVALYAGIGNAAAAHALTQQAKKVVKFFGEQTENKPLKVVASATIKSVRDMIGNSPIQLHLDTKAQAPEKPALPAAPVIAAAQKTAAAHAKRKHGPRNHRH